MRIRGIAVSFVPTALFALTWAMFPEIGSPRTSIALGPRYSYGWPIFCLWYAVVVALGSSARPGSEDEPSVSYFLFGSCLAVLVSCWGLALYDAMATSDSRFIRDFLGNMGALLVGIPVVGLYWGGMVVSAIAVVVGIPAFLRGCGYLLSSRPTVESSKHGFARGLSRLEIEQRAWDAKKQARLDSAWSAFVKARNDRIVDILRDYAEAKGLRSQAVFRTEGHGYSVWWWLGEEAGKRWTAFVYVELDSPSDDPGFRFRKKIEVSSSSAEGSILNSALEAAIGVDYDTEPLLSGLPKVDLISRSSIKRETRLT